MQKEYRKRGVVIKAVQFTGTPESVGELAEFMREALGVVTEEGLSYYVAKTLEGDMKILTGDYVIRGVKGEFYPCKPDIFEATYIEEKVTGLSFERALDLLKQGCLVRRAGWNGKGMHIALMPGFPGGVPATKEAARAMGVQEGEIITVRPYLMMKDAQGCMVPGWCASQTDLFAEDWELAE